MKGPTGKKIGRQVRKRDFVLIRLILLLTVDSTDGLGKKGNVLMQQDRPSTCGDTCSFPCTAEKVFYAHCISNILAFKRAWQVQNFLSDLKKPQQPDSNIFPGQMKSPPAAKRPCKGRTGCRSRDEQSFVFENTCCIRLAQDLEVTRRSSTRGSIQIEKK